MTFSPYIIPFFISHQGCPHQCVFCNQEVITGERKRNLSGSDVKKILSQKFSEFNDQGRRVEVAFYGGSFTGIPEELQKELLGAVQPFLNQGKVKAIRLSTRPDYLDSKRAAMLVSHGVQTVELGVQSLDDIVLTKSGRGHTRQQVEKAFSCLKREGLKVGGQIMIGLPGDTPQRIMKSGRRLAELEPDMIRIYPALVLKGSPLARLYGEGKFTPLSFNKSLALTVKLKELFDRRNIPVIRMGLQPSSSLESDLLAGPYHPAFGELVNSRIYFNKVRKILISTKRPAILSLACRDESVFRGLKNFSFKRLETLGLLRDIQITFSNNQPRNVIAVQSLS